MGAKLSFNRKFPICFKRLKIIKMTKEVKRFSFLELSKMKTSDLEKLETKANKKVSLSGIVAVGQNYSKSSPSYQAVRTTQNQRLSLLAMGLKKLGVSKKDLPKFSNKPLMGQSLEINKVELAKVVASQEDLIWFMTYRSDNGKYPKEKNFRGIITICEHRNRVHLETFKTL